MKFLKIFLFAFLIIFSAPEVFSQNNAKINNCADKKISTNKAVPTVQVIVKKPAKPNYLIEKVLLITDYDELLTELIILEINKTKTKKVKNVFPDEEYDKLSPEIRRHSIRESEVIEIMKKLTE